MISKSIRFCRYDTEHDNMNNRKPKEKSKKYISHGISEKQQGRRGLSTKVTVSYQKRVEINKNKEGKQLYNLARKYI